MRASPSLEFKFHSVYVIYNLTIQSIIWIGPKTPCVSYTKNSVWLTSSYHISYGWLATNLDEKGQESIITLTLIYTFHVCYHMIYLHWEIKQKQNCPNSFREHNSTASSFGLRLLHFGLPTGSICDHSNRFLQTWKWLWESFHDARIIFYPYLNFAFLQKVDKICVNLL